MSQSCDRKEPIVEPAPSDDYASTLTSRALGQRIRQQELLAELGVLALQGTSFMDMLNHAARITAEGLEAEYCKVLEYIPAENRLLVRAERGGRRGSLARRLLEPTLHLPAVTRCGLANLLFPTTSKMSNASGHPNCSLSMAFVER